MSAIRKSWAAWWLMATSTIALATSAIAQEPATDALALSDQTVLTVEVVNQAGDPIEGAEAYLIENTNSIPLSHIWQKSDEWGKARFDASSVDADWLAAGESQPVTLIVRAGGYAWSMQNVTAPSDEPVRVMLGRGRQVEIALNAPDGMELPPTLRPIVFAEGQSVAAWLTNVQRYKNPGQQGMFSAEIPERMGAGRFRIDVPTNCKAIWILVNEPGVLRAFQAGPFDEPAMSTGSIEIALPRPATLAVHLGPDENMTHDYSNCGMIVYTSPEIPDGGWSFRVQSQYAESPTLDTEIADLAPQGYSVDGMTGDKATWNDRSRADYYSNQRWAELAAGERHVETFALQTYDEAAQRAKLKGDHSLTVKVTLADGSPAAGRPYVLAFSLRQFGKTLEIASGVLPESGEIALSGLPPGKEAYIKLRIGDDEVGGIFIEEGKVDTEFAVSLAPKVGDPAPEMELTRLSDSSTFKLSSLRGQVVYVDFWASWCGPCQEPMAHGDLLMARRTDWKGRAVMIGASIDNGIDIIREHVNKRGWTHVLQTYCSEGEAGWNCDAAKRYAIRAVPTAYLIDQEGRIAWTGHPAEIDVEKEIESLLNK